nr:translational initiation factor 1 [Rhaphiolepis brevipetiolata]ULM62107.1 translational initiation factor 1 [Rhaphiolepis brevipetiolata]
MKQQKWIHEALIPEQLTDGMYLPDSFR